MSQVPVKSWAEYSDASDLEDSEDNESPAPQSCHIETQNIQKETFNTVHSKAFIQEQMELIQKVNANSVWIDLWARPQHKNYLIEIVEKLQKQKAKNNSILHILPSTVKNNYWNAEVKIELAKQWIEKGLQSDERLLFEVSDVNFKKKYVQKPNPQYKKKPIKRYVAKEQVNNKYSRNNWRQTNRIKGQNGNRNNYKQKQKQQRSRKLKQAIKEPQKKKKTTKRAKVDDNNPFAILISDSD